MQDLEDPKFRKVRLDLLQAFFDIGFRLKNGDQPSDWWRELAQEHLEKRNLKEAVNVAARIEGVSTLLAMRVDRRFDEVVRAMPEKFDLTAAHDRNVQTWRARVAAAPSLLDYRCLLGYALRDAGRYAEALAAIDDAMEAGAKNFTDWQTQYPWALTVRGLSLLNLGRHVEGLEALRAAEFASPKNESVSFVINLGLYQERLGQPEEALKTLQRVEGANNYGKLLVSAGSLGAHRQNGNDALAAQELRKVREKSHYSRSVYLAALLRAGQLDTARDALLERLRDPELRNTALLDVQTYKDPAPLPAEVSQRAMRAKLLALPEVQQAILQVGRMETFDFPEP
jgi:tetratricopeptide (TPR) repeat protein